MPMTLIVVAITAVVSYLAWQKPALMSRLILWPPAVNRSKQYDRLVSYGFIHADGMHLFFNMFTLYFFGRVVEQLFGTLGFVAFYLAALVVSILPSYLSHRDDANYRSLGASGAVSACLFAAIVLEPWSKILIYGVLPIPAIIYAVLYVAYSIWMDRRGRDNVNHSAHLWGAAFGMLAVLLAVPGAASHFLRVITHFGG